MINHCRICGEPIGPGRFTCSKIQCVRLNFRRTSSIRRHRTSRLEFSIYGVSGQQLEQLIITEIVDEPQLLI